MNLDFITDIKRQFSVGYDDMPIRFRNDPAVGFGGLRFCIQRKKSRFDQQEAVCHSISRVDPQDFNRCPPDRRSPNENRTVPGEMFVPVVEPRIEQALQLVELRIISRDVGALV